MHRATTELLASSALSAGTSPGSQELYLTLTTVDNPPAVIATGLFGLGRAQLAGGKPRESERTLARLVEEFSEAVVVVDGALVRGQALEQLGRTDEALAMYERSIDLQGTAAQRDRGHVARGAAVRSAWALAGRCYPI